MRAELQNHPKLKCWFDSYPSECPWSDAVAEMEGKKKLTDSEQFQAAEQCGRCAGLRESFTNKCAIHVYTPKHNHAKAISKARKLHETCLLGKIEASNQTPTSKSTPYVNNDYPALDGRGSRKKLGFGRGSRKKRGRKGKGSRKKRRT